MQKDQMEGLNTMFWVFSPDNDYKIDDFREDVKGYRTPWGKDFSLDDLSALKDICGNDIGDIHTPKESFTAGKRGLVCLMTIEDSMTVLGYAAIRYHESLGEESEHTYVIDLFGIHPEYRDKKLGKKFLENVESAIQSDAQEMINNGDTEYQISLQATFNYESYVMAMVKCGKEKGHDRHVIKASIDMKKVFRQMKGSCKFWYQMGFDKYKFSFNPSSPKLSNPILIMWKNQRKTFC